MVQVQHKRLYRQISQITSNLGAILETILNLQLIGSFLNLRFQISALKCRKGGSPPPFLPFVNRFVDLLLATPSTLWCVTSLFTFYGIPFTFLAAIKKWSVVSGQWLVVSGQVRLASAQCGKGPAFPKNLELILVAVPP